MKQRINYINFCKLYSLNPKDEASKNDYKVYCVKYERILLLAAIYLVPASCRCM